MGKKADVEKFSKFLLKILEGISVDEQDKVVYDNMIERLTLRLFYLNRRILIIALFHINYTNMS